MDIKKPNDVFVAILQKPNADMFDVIKSNMTIENTQLLSKDEYKRLDKVKKIFSDEKGIFNEDSFNKYYDSAVSLYREMSEDKVLAELLTYDPNDYGAPMKSKKVDVRPTIRTDYNPYQNYYSLTGVNTVDINELSNRELAQNGKIWDYDNNKWLDVSANDLGFFKSLFGKTLVYAIWDFDGESFDPVIGKTVAHKKGEWKTDKTGSFYIETLGKREMYGKQLVNPLDLLTKEGTKINDVDFFDSDGKDKSIIGTTMKFAVEILPFFIPRVNVIYGGIKMAMGLSATLPTFYKSLEGLLLGEPADGIETPMWKAMNKIEGAVNKISSPSLSDFGQQGMWNYEQLGSMVSSIFSQIYEQRAAASLSKLFYKVNDKKYMENLATLAHKNAVEGALAGKIPVEQVEDVARRAFMKGYENTASSVQRSKLAKNLSLGYMALTQSSNVYSDALAGGYDRRTAGFTSLLAASGQYALMANNQMGTWFLDKTTGYTENESKAVVRKAVKDSYGKVKEAFDMFDVDQVAGKAKLATAVSGFKSKIKTLLTEPILESEFAENIIKRSIIEGVEEVTEQAAIDASKGIVDVMSALGFTPKKGSFGGFDVVFSKAGFENYLANFVGGAIGGPLFELQRSIIEPMVNREKISLSTEADLYNLISTGRTADILSEIDNMKGKLWDNEIHVGESNVEINADTYADLLKQRVKWIDSIVNSENLKNTDEDLIKKSIMDQIYINDIKKSGVDNFLLSDAKEIGLQIVNLKNQQETLKDSNDLNTKKLVEEKLNKKRQEFNDLVSGKYSEYYHGWALFTLNTILHQPFINMSVDEYVKNVYDKDYYHLSDEEKNKYLIEFEELKSNTEVNFKEKMRKMFNIFLNMNEKFSKAIKEYDSDGFASVRSAFMDAFINSTDGQIDYIKLLDRLNDINTTLTKNGYPKYSLDSQTFINVGKFLLDNNIIKKNTTDSNKAVIVQDLYKYISDTYNTQNQEEATKLADKMWTMYQLYNNINKQVPIKNLDIDSFIELVETGKYNDGEKQLTLQLNDELDALGATTTTSIKPGVEELFNENPELANAVYEVLGFNVIKESEITYTDEDGKPCAKMGLTNTIKGTGWKIVKDFKGKPKHSQGGVDITISNKGVSIRRGGKDIKAKYGLLIPNNN